MCLGPRLDVSAVFEGMLFCLSLSNWELRSKWNRRVGWGVVITGGAEGTVKGQVGQRICRRRGHGTWARAGCGHCPTQDSGWPDWNEKGFQSADCNSLQVIGSVWWITTSPFRNVREGKASIRGSVIIISIVLMKLGLHEEWMDGV